MCCHNCLIVASYHIITKLEGLFGGSTLTLIMTCVLEKFLEILIKNRKKSAH